MSERRHPFQLPQRLRILNKYVLNRLLRAFVPLPFGPFAIIHHVGRRSGKPYETVLWVWQMRADFVIAQTYGPNVDWYRNMRAAGGGAITWHRRVYTVGKPEPIDLDTALPAFPAAFRPLFRKAGMKDFVWMKTRYSKPVRA